MMQDQVIVGFAARKQGGKDTCCGCIKVWRPDAEKFSFATPLKRMAIDILGLQPRQVFGTDEDKRELVPHLLWENFPLPVTESGYVFDFPNLDDDLDDRGHYFTEAKLKTGPMMVREVLQFFGTEIFRRQYPNVWADACIREIRKSGCRMALVADVRFSNEVSAIQEAGGKVVRLTRNPYPEDTHPSETMLDPENFDQSRFDAVIDNAEMTIEEQCEELYGILRRWGYVTAKRVGRMHV